MCTQMKSVVLLVAVPTRELTAQKIDQIYMQSQ